MANLASRSVESAMQVAVAVTERGSIQKKI